MSAKSDTFENDLLLLLFNNVNIGTFGDATGLRGSTAAGSLYIALHTADPGDAGNQSTSEASYSGYARLPVVRSSAEWTVAANEAQNADTLEFAACPIDAGDATHFTVGLAASGAGKVLYHGALSPIVLLRPGVSPRVQPGAIKVTEN